MRLDLIIVKGRKRIIVTDYPHQTDGWPTWLPGQGPRPKVLTTLFSESYDSVIRRHVANADPNWTSVATDEWRRGESLKEAESRLLS